MDSWEGSGGKTAASGIKGGEKEERVKVLFVAVLAQPQTSSTNTHRLQYLHLYGDSEFSAPFSEGIKKLTSIKAAAQIKCF